MQIFIRNNETNSWNFQQFTEYSEEVSYLKNVWKGKQMH